MMAPLFSNNHYAVRTRWRVEATRQEIASITQRPEDLMRWWSTVFMNSRITSEGDGYGAGTRFACHVKGWLPHTFHFQGVVTESVYGRRLAVEVTGEFRGAMEVDIEEDGAFCVIQFNWRVWAEKPLVRRLSFLIKPVFYANHLWVMRTGMKGMKRELARLRTLSGSPSPESAPGPLGA